MRAIKTAPVRRHERLYSCPVEVIRRVELKIPGSAMQRLRRNIKWKRNASYVYLNDVTSTGKLLITNSPIEERDDLVGCYAGPVTAAQLRDDIAEALA